MKDDKNIQVNDISYNFIESDKGKPLFNFQRILGFRNKRELDTSIIHAMHNEDRNSDIKYSLMMAIHYNIHYPTVVMRLRHCSYDHVSPGIMDENYIASYNHPVLIPTLLEMIRERPHYPRVMTRILLIFIYLENSHYATLKDSIKDELDKYESYLIQTGANGRAVIFLRTLSDTLKAQGSARDASNLYRSRLLKEGDVDGASMVEDELKGVWWCNSYFV